MRKSACIALFSFLGICCVVLLSGMIHFPETGAGLFRISRFVPTCEQWSCERPLVSSSDSRWPAPRPELREDDLGRWQRLHQQHVQEAAGSSDGARVAFLGDSITEGWVRTGFSTGGPSTDQPECRELWDASFGEWKSLNFGIGGDRVQDLGWRLQNGLMQATLRPDLFVVLIGTNDIGVGESAGVTLAEIKVLLGQIHGARPKAQVLLHGLLPRGGDKCTPRTPGFHRSGWWDPRWNNHVARIEEINVGLADLANQQTWSHYVECNAPFLGIAENPKEQSLPLAQRRGGARYIRPEMMYDLLHLTPLGYRAWAECLKPAIARLLV